MFHMNSLTELELSRCVLNYDDLEILKYLPNLEILNLRGNGIFFQIHQKVRLSSHLNLHSN